MNPIAEAKTIIPEIIHPLLTHQLSFSFISIQMILGSLIPFILLMGMVLLNRYLHEKVRNTIAFVASFLLILQVFAMRWNVVIGGQIFSKSLRGFRDYHPLFLEKEGILPAILIFILPFGIKEVFIGFIAGIKDLNIHYLPSVGETIETHIEITNEVMGITIVEAKSFCGGRPVANCEIRIFIQKNENG